MLGPRVGTVSNLVYPSRDVKLVSRRWGFLANELSGAPWNFGGSQWNSRTGDLATFHRMPWRSTGVHQVTVGWGYEWGYAALEEFFSSLVSMA
jgi:hypothetical protein